MNTLARHSILDPADMVIKSHCLIYVFTVNLTYSSSSSSSNKKEEQLDSTFITHT